MLFDAEAETTKQEIFNLLLEAGYFRISIPSLNDFDKILGGLSWGILCSGFDIDLDLEYSDEFQLGQKIKLSERVITGLKAMRCPYPLQPHQIRGLDYNSIHPIIKWLLEFVEETREERKDTNQFISSEIGDRLIYKQRNYFELPCVPKAKILSKNTKIENYNIDDPIRIYSCLAEMGDKKAAGIYQKMILQRIADAEKGDKKPKLKKDKSDIKPISFDFKEMQSAPVKKEKKIVIEKVVSVAPDQIEEFAAKTRLKRSGTIDQDEFMKILENHQEDNEDLVEKLKVIEAKQEGTAGSELQKEKAIFEE